MCAPARFLSGMIQSGAQRCMESCLLRASVLAAILGCLLPLPAAHAQVDEVSPKIGNVGLLLEPTRPTVSLPNSMIRVYPVRRDGLDDQIQSFPLTIISHRLGELFSLMAGSSVDAAAKPAGYDQETSTPYYYSARFEESGIQVEFTPGARSGVFRITSPRGEPALMLGCRHGGELQAQGQAAISGFEPFHDMKAFVYGEFAGPGKIAQASKARLTFVPLPSGKPVEFRYGISFISVAQAKRNFQNGDGSFEQMKRRARQAWDNALGQIQVAGGTPAQRRVFYTALYRCLERMVNISEEGRYYSAFDHRVHEDTRSFYVDNWLWDTYRGLEPLQTLLNPEQQADKIQSYVRMYEQSGWMPSFAVLWGDYACMTGNHAAAWMADAWFKGVRNFDVNKAYEGVKKNSLEATILPWRNGPRTSLDDFYNEHGYLPALHPGEKETIPEVHRFERRQAISVTLEQSYDDWCTAQLAREAGQEKDVPLFLKRAANYRNLYRADKGFMWPKDAQGNWIEPFDPKFSGGQGGRDYTTENNDYTYNWDVQHDFKGLAELMGGTTAARQKLDELFRADLGRSKYEFFAVFPDSTGMVGQFAMGNEPSFATPYVYNHLGAPWSTQKRLRQLLEYWFTDTAMGIPGDEDGGGMSAFVVFSMMGFYPVVPGLPVYELGSPVFDRVTIRLHNGKTVRINTRNNSYRNKYVAGFKLNGGSQSRVWFSHSDLLKGARLDLQMSDTPNRTLGINPADFPPSSIDADPRRF
jgi:predicted alpha-1,2-mannosidase